MVKAAPGAMNFCEDCQMKFAKSRKINDVPLDPSGRLMFLCRLV